MNLDNYNIKLIATTRELMASTFLYNLSKHQLIENIKTLFSSYSIPFNDDNINLYLELIGNAYAINIWNYLKLSDDYIIKVDSNKIISCFKYFITLDLNIQNNIDKIESCVKAYNKYNNFDIIDIKNVKYLDENEKIMVVKLMIKYKLKIKKIELENIIRLCVKYNQLFEIFLNSKKDFISYKNIFNKNILSYSINIFYNNSKKQFNIIDGIQSKDKKMIKKIITKINNK